MLRIGRIFAHEIFLVHPGGQLDHLFRDIQKRGIKAAEQWHRPFGQAGILDYQAFILDQIQSGIRCSLGGTGADDILTFLMVDKNMAGAEFFGIVGGVADGDPTGVMKAVADRLVT